MRCVAVVLREAARPPGSPCEVPAGWRASAQGPGKPHPGQTRLHQGRTLRCRDPQEDPRAVSSLPPGPVPGRPRRLQKAAWQGEKRAAGRRGGLLRLQKTPVKGSKPSLPGASPGPVGLWLRRWGRQLRGPARASPTPPSLEHPDRGDVSQSAGTLGVPLLPRRMAHLLPLWPVKHF